MQASPRRAAGSSRRLGVLHRPDEKGPHSGPTKMAFAFVLSGGGGSSVARKDSHPGAIWAANRRMGIAPLRSPKGGECVDHGALAAKGSTGLRLGRSLKVGRGAAEPAMR